MHFDTKEYLDALDAPSIDLGGRVYTGRLLSIHQWLPFKPRVSSVISEEGIEYTEIRKLCLDYCRAAFPRPWWKFWQRSVGRQVVALPPAVMMKALAAFFACQGRAMMLQPLVEESDAGDSDTTEPQPATSSHGSLGITEPTVSTPISGQPATG